MNSNDDDEAGSTGYAIPQLRLVTTGAEKAVGYRPDRKIDDIRGIATVKRNLQEIIDAIKNRADNPVAGWLGGVLLYGPSGCGKVFFAEVIASELDATMYLFDVGAGWDRKTFEQTLLDALAESTGLITLHFENVDSPAAAELRSDTLLDALDKAGETGDVVITASAILPWQASTQLVQRGRLSRVVLVLPPDPPSRSLFIREQAQGRAELSDDDLYWIVQHTEGHSFTDLETLLNVALGIAAHTQTSSIPHVDRAALRGARQAVGPSSAEWLSKAGHHALMSQEGGLYDDLLQYFQVRHQRH